MHWLILKTNSSYLQLTKSLPIFIIYLVKYFAVFYCKVIIIIVTGIYFTGFT